MYNKEAGELIVRVAQYYIGRLEKKSNAGFQDEKFEKEMRSFGFQPGWSWCALFCELVWRKAYRILKLTATEKLLGQLFSASVLATKNNFVAYGCKLEREPQVGSLVIMQHGRSALGHIGVVEKIEKGYVHTIEGNTSAAGSREGDRVDRKKREIKFGYKPGLHILGFIQPI